MEAEEKSSKMAEFNAKLGRYNDYSFTNEPPVGIPICPSEQSSEIASLLNPSIFTSLSFIRSYLIIVFRFFAVCLEPGSIGWTDQLLGRKHDG